MMSDVDPNAVGKSCAEGDEDDVMEEEFDGPYDEPDGASDDEDVIDGLKHTNEKKFWNHYYELSKRFPDERKCLLSRFESALENMTGAGTIDWHPVDPRIGGCGGGYIKALQNVTPDIQELAASKNLTRKELDELVQLAEKVRDKRKQYAKDRGHRQVSAEWNEVVKGLKKS